MGPTERAEPKGPSLPFDPIERAQWVEGMVMDGEKRKYYRLRPARYYGGIATADAVGCCLLCAYCWNYRRNLDPGRTDGFFLSPGEVAGRLLEILRRKGFNKVRISGAEPVLGWPSLQHLVEVLEIIARHEPMVDFVLETNGLMFGVDPALAKELSGFRRLLVRICIKGWDGASFERISGARSEFFGLPLEGLRHILDAGITAWPAVMYEIFGPRGIEEVSEVLRRYGISPEELEIEYLEPYPFVMDNLRDRKVELRAEPILWER